VPGGRHCGVIPRPYIQDRSHGIFANAGRLKRRAGGTPGVLLFRDMLKIKDLEQALIEKVVQLFRDML
jgi:hypothetical protein